MDQSPLPHPFSTPSGRTLLLTGRPGVGKTTIITAVVDALGDRAGGFYTEEIRSSGGRKGFRLVTLGGQEAVMAHVNLRGANRPQVSRYGVDLRVIEHVGVAAIQRAIDAEQIVVVDEIGKMELLCSPFRQVMLRAARGPNPVLATAMSKPNPWVDAFKAMPRVTLWEVTMKNRERMAKRVVDWIG